MSKLAVCGYTRCIISCFISRPVFRICVLYVDEEISVQRQLSRGRMIRQHNLEVKKTGQGVFWDERVTDNDESVSINNFYKLSRNSSS